MIKNKPVWRRRIAVLLAALLVLSVLPVTGAVYAKDGDTSATYSGTITSSPGDLSVTKTVTGTGSEKDKDRVWNFTIELTKPTTWSGTNLSNGPFTYSITPDGESNQVSFDGSGKITLPVELKGGQTLTIVGLPDDTSYTVTENNTDENYESKADYSSSNKEGDKTTDIVTFTNTAHYGSLKITKALSGSDQPDVSTKVFKFTVTGPNEYSKEVTITGTSSETLTGLVPGTYTVTETDGNMTGYTYSYEVTAGGTTAEKGSVTVVKDTETDVTVTNTYTKLGSLTITKKVEDGGAPVSDKEYSFTVTGPSYPSGESFTLKAGGSKTLENLIPGEYTITEANADDVEGYKWSASGNGDVTVEPGKKTDTTITNTYTQILGSLKITKAIDGGGTDAENKTYTFIVTGPSCKDGREVTITGANSVTIPDLIPGTYTVTEKNGEIDGYSLEVSGENKNTYTVVSGSEGNLKVTNTYTRETGNLKIIKTVEVTGGNNEEAKTSKEYKFTIQGPADVNGPYSGVTFTNGTAEVTITGSNSVLIEGLPTGPYTVAEVNENAQITGWALQITGQNNDTVTVEAGKTTETTIDNEYTPKTGSLTIKKTVVANGAAAGKTYTFTVTGPSYPGGQEFVVEVGKDKLIDGLLPGEYTIAEVKDGTEIQNWTLNVEGEDKYTVAAEGNTDVEITNTYTRLKGDLTVTKTVAGDDAEYDRVWNFTVTLSDTSVNGTYGDMTFENGVAKFTLKHEESKTAKDLPAGVEYTVTETEADQDGYGTSFTGEKGTIPANGEAKASFKNERPKPDEPTMGSLIIAKTVKGGGTEAAEREYEFTITGPNGFTKTVKVKGGDKSKAIEVDPGTYTITEENGEIGGFTHTVTINNGEEVTVEKGKELTVEVINDYTPNPGKLTITKAIVGGGTEAAGKTYTFTITGPTWPDGHDVTVTGAGSVTVDVAPGTYTVTEKGADIPGYTLEVTGGGEVTVESDKTVDVTVTNTYTENPKGDLTVTKTVTGTAGDQTKDWTFTVTLSDTTISGVYGGMTFTDGVATFTLKHGESKTATGLPAGTGYTVTEAEANTGGYTTTAEGATGTIPNGGTAEASFVNDNQTPPPPTEPTTGSLTVSKAIVGGGTAAAEKTYTFTVTGPSWPEGRTLTVTGAGSVTLSNLTPGTYTVTEADAGISGYDWTVSGEGGVTVEAGRNSHITITNTYNDTEPDTGRLTVTKAIVGGGDAAAAKTYTFTVTGPDGYTNTVTVTGAGRVTLTDLVPGAYTVTEQDASIPGWTLEVTGGGEVTVEAGETAETTITNTYTETEKETGSLTVTKTVVGGGSAAAGKTYTFTVTGPDGYTNTVAVTGAGSATLTDLVPGTYTVTEQDASIPGWTLEVTGGGEVTVEAGKTAETTVTNTYTEIPYGGLTVRKIVDGEGGDKEKEFTFTVTLSDTSINGAYGGITFANGVATFTLKHGESVTAEGLPSGTGYTVTEAEANTDGYVSTSTGAVGAIPHGGAALAEFRNNKGTPTPGTGRLVIRKAVTGSEGDKDREFHFTVTLSDTSINGAYGDLTFVNGVAEFTLRSGENKWAKELPAGTGYTVTETEADQDGYTTTITGATGTIPENSYGVWAEARFLNTKGPEPDEPDNPDNPDEPGEPEEPFEELFDPDIPLSEMPDEPFDDAPGTGGSYQLGLWTALAALSLVGMLLAIVPLTSVNGRHVKRKGRSEKGR